MLLCLQECESSKPSLGFVAIKANFAFPERKENNNFYLGHFGNLPLPFLLIPQDSVKVQKYELVLEELILIFNFHSVFVIFNLHEENPLDFFKT